MSRTNSLKQVIDLIIWVMLWLELDEGALLDLIGDILSHELGHQGEGKLEAGSGSSAGHDVSIDDNPVLEKTRQSLISKCEIIFHVLLKSVSGSKAEFKDLAKNDQPLLHS